jgi:hypothetical protein
MTDEIVGLPQHLVEGIAADLDKSGIRFGDTAFEVGPGVDEDPVGNDGLPVGDVHRHVMGRHEAPLVRIRSEEESSGKEGNMNCSTWNIAVLTETPNRCSTWNITAGCGRVRGRSAFGSIRGRFFGGIRPIFPPGAFFLKHNCHNRWTDASALKTKNY